jgi:hypothetical protein
LGACGFDLRQTNLQADFQILGSCPLHAWIFLSLLKDWVLVDLILDRQICEPDFQMLQSFSLFSMIGCLWV